MNVDNLEDKLRKLQNNVEVRLIYSFEFPSKYCRWYVIYSSSNDPGLYYKSYKEDKMLYNADIKKQSILSNDENIRTSSAYNKSLSKNFYVEPHPFWTEVLAHRDR